MFALNSRDDWDCIPSASSQRDSLSCGQRARQVVAHVWVASILSQYYRNMRVQLELCTRACFGYVSCYWDI